MGYAVDDCPNQVTPRLDLEEKRRGTNERPRGVVKKGIGRVGWVTGLEIGMRSKMEEKGKVVGCVEKNLQDLDAGAGDLIVWDNVR